jgi:starvation-inducible DNA-binding protein
MDEQNERVGCADALGTVLADTFILYLKTHQCHWNVEGAMFPMLHKLFGKQYESLWATVDLVAERIRALGFTAPSGMNIFAQMTTLPDLQGAPSALEMVRLLLADHEACSRGCMAALRTCQAAGDEASVNMLAGLVEYHDKQAWFLRATAK